MDALLFWIMLPKALDNSVQECGRLCRCWWEHYSGSVHRIYGLTYWGWILSPPFSHFVAIHLVNLCFLFCKNGNRSFPDSSVGKESTCNAGDSGLIPGSGWSTGEGIGYPFQYSWASLVAQFVKNPPAMRETWVLSLGWEDSLEKGKGTHSSILAWRIQCTV